MKPSSKNEVMNGIVGSYLLQKASDATLADTWKYLNGEDIAVKSYDLSALGWKGLHDAIATFETAIVTYKDGHAENSILWKDESHVYAIEMNEIGSVTFHVADFGGSEKEAIKPTDESSSSVLKMLLTLENGGGGGSSDAPTKEQFEALVKVTPTDINVDEEGYLYLEHDGAKLSGQKKQAQVSSVTILRGE